MFIRTFYFVASIFGIHSLFKIFVVNFRLEELSITVDIISSTNNIALPMSSTCGQRISIPLYPSKSMLKQKLLQAIECKSYGLGWWQKHGRVILKMIMLSRLKIHWNKFSIEVNQQNKSGVTPDHLFTNHCEISLNWFYRVIVKREGRQLCMGQSIQEWTK